MGDTHYYTFPIIQNGTYWYHSHTMMQQQSGLYGAIVIHKKNEPPVKEYTLLLSETRLIVPCIMLPIGMAFAKEVRRVMQKL
ncbi:MAG: multicopper oxidase domain-containing protein [Ferruginibacter sp.]